jgi:hypothetical protein
MTTYKPSDSLTEKERLEREATERRRRINTKYSMHGERYLLALIDGDFDSWQDFGVHSAPMGSQKTVIQASYKAARRAQMNGNVYGRDPQLYSKLANMTNPVSSDR